MDLLKGLGESGSIPEMEVYRNMKKILILGAALAATSVTAFADTHTIHTKIQADSLVPTNVTMRLGAFIPGDTTMKDSSATWYTLSLEYIPGNQFISGSETYLMMEYFGKSTSGKGWALPITVNQRVIVNGANSESHQKTYAFIGVGAAFMDIVDSNTVLMFRGGLGLELGQKIVAEIAGYMSGKDRNDVRLNGLGFSLGYKF